MRFVLNGCDISFTAEAPEDITLKQLLKQCDKIQPDWCAPVASVLMKNWDIKRMTNQKLLLGMIV